MAAIGKGPKHYCKYVIISTEKPRHFHPIVEGPLLQWHEIWSESGKGLTHPIRYRAKESFYKDKLKEFIFQLLSMILFY